MKFITIFLLTFALAGCGYLVDEEEVIQAAEKQGYTNIEIIDSHEIMPKWAGGCGDRDNVAFEATATNSLGKKVDLILCAGWPFKGVTVRTK